MILNFQLYELPSFLSLLWFILLLCFPSLMPSLLLNCKIGNINYIHTMNTTISFLHAFFAKCRTWKKTDDSASNVIYTICDGFLSLYLGLAQSQSLVLRPWENISSRTPALKVQFSLQPHTSHPIFAKINLYVYFVLPCKHSPDWIRKDRIFKPHKWKVHFGEETTFPLNFISKLSRLCSAPGVFL